MLNSIVHAEPDLAEVPDATLRDLIAACLAKEPEGRPGLEELLTWLSDPAPTAQAWLPPAVRDLADSYAAEGPTAAGHDRAAPTRQLPDAATRPTVADRVRRRFARVVSPIRRPSTAAG